MFKKKNPTVVTTRGLSNVVLEERIMFVPAYSEKQERELIVIPREILGHKLKRKKPVKDL